jgi:hypothetical protein
MVKKEKDISVEIIKNKNLTKKYRDTINKARKKEFGKDSIKDFKEDYENETLWFFVKRKNKIVSLGGLRPIKIKYLGKIYSIRGICSSISLIKDKGYGTIIVNTMINYAQKTGKILLGFTEATAFFKKTNLETKKGFIKRFVWIKSNGKKVYDNKGDGIYYEGKDKLISKILKTKSLVYIKVEHW